jgi:lipoyl(octanoyl) transferase
MVFDHLPRQTATPAENMAIDLLLLEQYPAPEHIRFRSYGWNEPAFTFGYSQRISHVQQGIAATVIRRATGGGLVNHTNDWTYALILPPDHAITRGAATAAYQLVHAALASALREQAVAADLQPEEKAPGAAAACFERAEPNDVILAADGRKLAGAAMKRNLHGLLLQGSVDRAPLPKGAWDRLEADFTAHLAAALNATRQPSPIPAWAAPARDAMIARFASRAWNERR